MPTVTYPVVAAADDYTHRLAPPPAADEHGNIVLNAQRNNIAAGLSKYAVTEIDTSAIPAGDMITKVVYRVYGDSYLATRGTSKIFNSSIWTGSGWSVYAIAVAWTTAGWYDIPMPSTHWQYISRSGMSIPRITVANPPAAEFRSMFIRAEEHTFGIFKAELVISHTPAYIFGTVIG